MLTKTEINLIKSLKDKKNRDETSLFVVEGVKMANELLAGKYDVSILYYTERYQPFVADLKYEGKKQCISEAEMSRISQLKTPTPVLALVYKPEYSCIPEKFKGELTLALDGIQDPGNLGTIIRLADWFGIKRIICSSDSVDCYNNKVIQSTMGAIFRVEVCYLQDLPDFLKRLKQNGCCLYGTFLEGECIYETIL